MRYARRTVAALTVLIAASACSGIGGGHGSGDAPVTPDLSEVSFLDDPKAYEGPSTAGLGDVAIEPVAENPTPDLPVTVTDNQGTEVTVESTDRILALDIYGTLSQTVYELGLGDQLVGRDVSTQFDEAADLPLVTSNGHELNAESILALDPTVILTDTSLGPWDVVLQMRDSGIPVVVVDSERSLDNLESLTLEIAESLGLPEEGATLAERIRAETDAVMAEIAKAAPSDVRDQMRMVFLYVRGQAGVYYMFGEGSGADALIKALGGFDVSSEISWSGMKPVTDEAIVAAQPELILMMTKGLESVGGVEGLLEHLPAIANTPAGENQRIVDMSDSQILSYGPLTPRILNALAVAVYAPEAAGVGPAAAGEGS